MLFVAIAAVAFCFTAQTNAWAQKDDELPKPDFSAMEKWYEIANVEHDVFAAELTFTAKAKKEESRPVIFWMQFLDKNGSKIMESAMLPIVAYFSRGNTPPEPVKVSVVTPREKDLSKVKTVKVVRSKE